MRGSHCVWLWRHCSSPNEAGLFLSSVSAASATASFWGAAGPTKKLEGLTVKPFKNLPSPSYSPQCEVTHPKALFMGLPFLCRTCAFWGKKQGNTATGNSMTRCSASREIRERNSIGHQTTLPLWGGDKAETIPLHFNQNLFIDTSINCLLPLTSSCWG